MATFTDRLGDDINGGARHDDPFGSQASDDGRAGRRTSGASACLSAADRTARLTSGRRTRRPVLLLAVGFAVLCGAPQPAWGGALTVGSERQGTHAVDDADGIDASHDVCAGTPSTQQTDASGCSIAQLCPCVPDQDEWQDHAAYLSCVARAGREFIDLGLIATTERDTILSRAVRSRCGRRS